MLHLDKSLVFDDLLASVKSGSTLHLPAYHQSVVAFARKVVRDANALDDADGPMTRMRRPVRKPCSSAPTKPRTAPRQTGATASGLPRFERAGGVDRRQVSAR